MNKVSMLIMLILSISVLAACVVEPAPTYHRDGYYGHSYGDHPHQNQYYYR